MGFFAENVTVAVIRFLSTILQNLLLEFHVIGRCKVDVLVCANEEATAQL